MNLEIILKYYKMKKIKVVILVLMGQILVSCNNYKKEQNFTNKKTKNQSNYEGNSRTTVYRSKDLIIIKISEHVYQHISFLDTNDFGRVHCNGMVVINNKEAVIFDSPTNDNNTEELIDFLDSKLGCTINAVVATHFHADCVGGLQAFHKHNIPSYASQYTIKLAKKAKFVVPQNGFKGSMSFEMGAEKVYVSYFGQGHTKDNVVGYFPADKVLFGGCLIKELGASKGNLEDANIKEWSETVKKIKATYHQVKIVVPGHGEIGGVELLDYTIALFK